MLGTYSHTEYNSPIEAQCSGSSTRQFQYNIEFPHGRNGTCGGIPCGTVSWTLDTAKPLWVSEVRENGSGVHTTAGLLNREWSCTEPSPQTGVRMREVSAPCGSCGPLVSGQSVATKPNHPDLGCRDKVYVVGMGTVTVMDTGDLDEAQLDHYIGRTPCNAAITLSPAKAIKLF